tara:strand:+ start:359 stop:625 length:267 start_codon:yes stop_codon:yes gene_type:complete
LISFTFDLHFVIYILLTFYLHFIYFIMKEQTWTCPPDVKPSGWKPNEELAEVMEQKYYRKMGIVSANESLKKKNDSNIIKRMKKEMRV